MRSLAGVFFLSIIALLWLVTLNASPNANPARGVTPAAFIPAKTPLPAAVPTAGPDEYRLKAWTEQDAIAAIAEGEKMLAEPDRSEGFDDEYAARFYLITILHETFMRFPTTQSQDRLVWESLREEANQGRGIGKSGQEVDEFLLALEKALNTSQAKTADLAGWLDERGFKLVSRHPARNLYGDGQEAELLHIERPQFIFPSDLLIVVEGARPGAYHVTSTTPGWRHFVGTQGGFQEIAIGDHNGNGRPEISSVIATGGHAACNVGMELYEWRGERGNGHLEDIAAGVLGTWGDYFYRGCGDMWEFGTPDSKGAQPLYAILRRHNPAGKPCRDYEFRVRYEWDGQKYSWVRGDAVPLDPGQPAKCFADWAIGAADHTLYDQAIPPVVSTLANWPPELDKVWGPSAKDYFRFKLGTWYAFAGQPGLAVATLLDVRDRRADQVHDMVSRMADAFLSRYQVLNNADDACDAVVNLVDADFKRIPDDELGFVATETTSPRWGFADPEWRYEWKPGFSDLCHRGRREDIPEPTEAPVSTLEPTPTPEATSASSLWELEARLTERMESVEKALFTDGDARQANVLARRLDAEPILAEAYKGSKEVEPHLLYLLALSSELAGDEPGAVSAYWQILHEYPKSHYAAMARRKLEPLTPQARADMQAPAQ